MSTNSIITFGTNAYTTYNKLNGDIKQESHIATEEHNKVTAPQCAKLCDTTTDCMGFTQNYQKDYCVLKIRKPHDASIPSNLYADSELDHKSGLIYYKKETEPKYVAGQGDCPGNDILSVTASHDVCQKLCNNLTDKNNRCTGYSYHDKSNICVPKTGFKVSDECTKDNGYTFYYRYE